MRFEPKLPDESVNYSAVSPLWELVKIGGLLFALIVAAYAALGWGAERLVEGASPEFEQKILQLIEPELPEHRESPALTALTRSLEGCSDLPYTPRIVLSDSKEVNAFALPGGTIVINRGFLEQCRSENELLFIIGHEMGHLSHRDHLRGMGYNLVGLSIGVLLGATNMPEIFGTGIRYGESRFSQRQERAADLFGLEMLQCHYGHVGGATDFFERHKAGDITKWLAFTTHPELASRIEGMEAEAEKRGYAKKAVTSLDPEAILISK